MANIIHTSTGATNTPRLLSVTGNTIELPQKSNIWFNWQIDSGLSVSGGRVLSWTDSENSIPISNTSGSPSTAPLHSSEYQLAGLNTVQFISTTTGALRNTASTKYWPSDVKMRKTTFVTLIRSLATAVYQEPILNVIASNGVYGALYIHHHVYPGGGSPKQNYIRLYCGHTQGTYIYDINIGTDIRSAWHVIQTSVDHDTKSISVYIDGNLVETISAPNMVWTAVPEPYHCYVIGSSSYTSQNASLQACVAAAIGWEDIILSPEEALAAATFLRTKYGLT